MTKILLILFAPAGAVVVLKDVFGGIWVWVSPVLLGGTMIMRSTMTEDRRCLHAHALVRVIVRYYYGHLLPLLSCSSFSHAAG